MEDCEVGKVLKFRQVMHNALEKLKVKVKSIEASQTWFKYKVHGISTEEFGGKDGMERLRDEIETHNRLLKLTMPPRWLTSENTRQGKKYSTVVIAVATQEEANVIKKGIFVLCEFRTTNEFLSARPTDQCTKCQKVAHTWKRCTANARCKICAGAHLSKDHHCKKCDKKGVSCGHIQLRCTNCGEGHMATHQNCPFLVNVRGSRAGSPAPAPAPAPTPVVDAPAPAAEPQAMDTNE